MILAQDTPILLLDEPTTYMDIEYQLGFMELLCKLRNQDKSIVTVLHNLDHAFHYSDEIVLMDSGEIKKTGTPEEMYSSGAVSEVFNIKLTYCDCMDGKHLLTTSGRCYGQNQ